MTGASLVPEVAFARLSIALVNTLFRYYLVRGLRRAWCQTRGSISYEYGIDRRNVLYAVRDIDVFRGSHLHFLWICHVHRSQQLLELRNSHCYRAGSLYLVWCGSGWWIRCDEFKVEDRSRASCNFPWRLWHS